MQCLRSPGGTDNLLSVLRSNKGRSDFRHQPDAPARDRQHADPSLARRVGACLAIAMALHKTLRAPDLLIARAGALRCYLSAHTLVVRAVVEVKERPAIIPFQRHL